MAIVNLIPMAGEGQRFKNEGYKLPKPLIEIDGVPMVIKALKSLPLADKNILIVRKGQFNITKFKNILITHFKSIEVIEVNHLTQGQACTCLLAKDLVPKNSFINIGACDVGFNYNQIAFDRAIQNFNAIIWTYTNNSNVLVHPEMYGWVKTKENSDIVDIVSCKKPISNDLMKDHVVSGVFSFKNSNLFFDAIQRMIEKDDRVNGEFYLDNIFNHISEKTGVFKVDDYFSWGTPQELNDYLNRVLNS